MIVRKNKINEKLICGIMLILAFLVFSSFYVRSVMMPQQGWWHYYAWRINEGEVLYKDLYVFLPPYFILITSLFFALFGNHFILYTLFVGLPIKILCLVILYKLLCRKFKPVYSFIGVLTGACVSAAYLTDIWYDYNPVAILPCLGLAWLIVEYNDSRNLKKRPLYAFICGAICGFLLMYKQTLGLAFGFILPVMMIVILRKQVGLNASYINRGLIHVIFFILGIICGCLPAFIYLLKNGCLKDFLHCINAASGAKGGIRGLLSHLLGTTLLIQYWLPAIAVIVLFVCYELLWKGRKTQFNISPSKNMFIAIQYTIYMAIIAGAALLVVKKPKLSGFIEKNMVGVFAAILVLGILIIVFHYHKPEILIRICRWKYSYLLFGCLMVILLLLWGNTDASIHEKIYVKLSLLNKRRIAMTILSYMFIAIWLKKLYQYFFCYSKDQDYSDVMYLTILNIHLFLGFMSAEVVEELFMLLYIPYPVAWLLQRNSNRQLLKNVLVNTFSIVLILTCLSSKIYMPYDWQGWRERPLKNLVGSDIEGLEGYKLPKKTAEFYSRVVNDINENTTSSDCVFQFANIPLFNVLTERKTGTYAPVPWFDVCPDTIAVQTAAELYANPPKIIIWHNMSEIDWNLLEEVFRNGEPSGQRAIKEFYDNKVKSSYTLLESYYNNRDGDIEVWLRND